MPLFHQSLKTLPVMIKYHQQVELFGKLRRRMSHDSGIPYEEVAHERRQ